MSEIHIEIDHPDNREAVAAIGATYNMDRGPLNIPDHIKIGMLTWDKQKIMSYDEQVDEYGVWLEDQIKGQKVAVLTELDTIYNKALGAGVVLTTRCIPSPYQTHAHVVKRVILGLAGG